MVDLEQLKAAIVALEAQRGNLGDAIVDMALAPLIAQRKVLETQPVELRLRQVTVLFADIVDSTSLGEQLGAEDVATVFSTVLERFGRVIAQHGGRVLRFTGDGLKGVFGAEVAEGDGPAAAVRAALALVTATVDLEAVLRASHGLRHLRIRVGVNTGVAAIGAGIEAGNTAMGATVNLAARLEQAAPPGRVLIGEDTQRHLRSRFDLVPQPPIRVKGHDAPLRTWIVEREHERSFMSLRRGHAESRVPLIGRDRELARLLEAMQRAREGSTESMLLIGEAGIGKSRLLRELLARAGVSRPLLAQAYPLERLAPYALLRDLLAGAFAIAETDTSAEATRKLANGLGAAASAEEADAVGQLIGFESTQGASTTTDARWIHEVALGAVTRWLKHRALASPPLLVVMDDLHWADDASLDWIERLGLDLAGSPLLLVATARPSLFETHATFGSTCSRLDVAPLDAGARTVLVSALLKPMAQVPTRLSERLTRDSDGNPFYMQELVNMLLDEGVIATHRGTAGEPVWTLQDDRLDLPAVPATLTGVLEARLDTLMPSHRRALQHAAIIGPVFWDAALETLAPGSTAAIDELTRRGFVQPRRDSAFAEAGELEFVHPLLHQVAYDTVLKADRIAGHRAIAAWLASRIAERAHEHLAVTAEHFARAGDRSDAGRFFELAAKDAARRFAHEAALTHGARALEQLDPGDHAARCGVHRIRQSIFDVLERRDEQGAELDLMSTEAEQADSDVLRAGVAVNRALLADRLADFDTAFEQAILAARLATEKASWIDAARAYGEWAWVLSKRGEFSEARARATTGLEHALRSGDALAHAQSLTIAAEIERADDHMMRAATFLRKGIELAAEHGMKRLEALMHGNLAGVLGQLLDFDAACEHSEAAITLYTAIGLPSGIAAAKRPLAQIALATGRPADALDLANQAAGSLEAIGGRYMLGQMLVLKGVALRQLGRPEEARETYSEAIVNLGAVKLSGALHEIFALIAELDLDRGDIDAATLRVQPLFTDISNIDQGRDPLRTLWILFRICVANHDDRALGWLAMARVRVEKARMRLPDDETRARFDRLGSVAWAIDADAALPDLGARAA